MLHKNGITIDPVRKTISHVGKTYEFQMREGRSIYFDLACALIIGGPLTHAQLTESLYENDPSGGPEWAQKSVGVNVHKLQEKINRIGLHLYTERNGSGDGCYVKKWIAA